MQGCDATMRGSIKVRQGVSPVDPALGMTRGPHEGSPMYLPERSKKQDNPRQRRASGSCGGPCLCHWCRGRGILGPRWGRWGLALLRAYVLKPGGLDELETKGD